MIGVGSPFGDDRAGWLVVDALRDATGEAAARGWVLELLALDRPGALLADALRGCDLAVVIDALADPERAGAASVVDPDRADGTGARLSSHGLGVAAALGLARALGDAPAQLVLVAVHVACDAIGPGDAAPTGTGATTAAGVARAAALVLDCLERAGCVAAAARISARRARHAPPR